MAYEIMEVEIISEELTERATKSVDSMRSTLQQMKAGRANAHILDNVLVDYYGTPTPINQMANITIPEARIIAISVWDASSIKKVEKALVDANLGITPNNDGKILRLIFPELTEERRKQLSKEVKAISENAKVAIRNIRRDAIDALKPLKKDSIVTEDEQHNIEKDFDKVINNFVAEIDKMATDKEKEIMSI